VAWVPAANLHVTLKFIGSIPEELVEGIALRLQRVAAKLPPFEARARGFGAFPSLTHPKVLWVGVEGEPLVKLQRAVEDAMAELGIEKEERAFHPHLTVGRVKEHHGSAPLPWSGDEDLGTSTVSEIVVYESRMHKSGSEYIARARVALGKEIQG
jgi:2'-5' RNA ligase